MHLKNFSLIDKPDTGYVLCPAYDMVASALVVKGDEEELALTLNGKKKKIRKKDFVEALNRFSIDRKAIENMFNKFKSNHNKWYDLIRISFLPKEMKENYMELITERIERLQL